MCVEGKQTTEGGEATENERMTRKKNSMRWVESECYQAHSVELVL